MNRGRVSKRQCAPGATGWAVALCCFVGHVVFVPKASGETARVVLGEAEALRSIAAEVPLWDAPSPGSRRRGTLGEGAEVWSVKSVAGTGCPGPWLLVGASAWACDGPGRFEGRDAAIRSPLRPSLALQYARVGPNGALGYRSISEASQGLPTAELQPGFHVALREARAIEGETYQRTTHDVWVLGSSLQPLTPSDFEGRSLENAPVADGLSPHLPVGWIHVENARPRTSFERPSLGRPVARLTALTVTSHRKDARRKDWFQTPLGWFSASQIRVPTRVASPPETLDASRNFIDVDTTTQTLVAYRNGSPVFATMVSTGRGAKGTPTATPLGSYRIWAKLTATDMDNLDERGRDAPRESEGEPRPIAVVEEPYAVESVPWVQFFEGGYGLHATYWHDQFGVPRSHGCVNLSLKDAAYLFEFTSPKAIPGWQAIHPSDYDAGTLIQIRESVAESF